MKSYQISSWCHHFIKNQVKEGDLCIDATVGNGQDTEVLCSLVGDKGLVVGLDIQEIALEKTRLRLENAGLLGRARLFLKGHEHMAEVVEPSAHGKVSCVVFNFGYLPGGNRQLATKGETSIKALERALDLLKKDGLISLCIYSGGDSGFEEREGILAWLKGLDPREYLVIVNEFYNRKNHPPLPVLIYKLLNTNR